MFQTADIILQVRATPIVRTRCGTDRRSSASRIRLARRRPSATSPQPARRCSRWNSCRASRARRAWTRCRRWPPSPATRACCWRQIALPRMFPMLMTAAGTIAAARVFIMGAGVAGLQAISTAQTPRREGRSLRRPAGGERTGAEPRREVRRAAARIGRRRRQGRLRQGAGRVVLQAPARDDAQGRRRQRRRHHHGVDSRKARAHPGDGAKWSRPWRRAR